MSMPETLGRYRIVRRLGAGAMGEVFLGEHRDIGRQAALKTLRLADRGAEDARDLAARLKREAQAAGRLIHPHVVTLFEYGEDAGMLYLAFEFVDGVDLAKRLRGGPPPTLSEALRWVREVASALDHAHTHGIVHRDIKPSNLMLTRDGAMKVADFGIARLAHSTELTRTGAVVGSPQYMSPEQVRGAPLDGRSDLFSLGVVFYELLAGRRPFDGETISTLVYQILETEPVAVEAMRSDMPTALAQMIRRMLAKDPEHRFPTAGALVAEIDHITSTMPTEVLDQPAMAATEVMTVPSQALGAPPPPPPTQPVAAAPPPPPPLPSMNATSAAAPPATPPPPAAHVPQPSQPIGATTQFAPKRKMIGIGLVIAAIVFLVIAAGLAAWFLGLNRSPEPPTELVAERAPVDQLEPSVGKASVGETSSSGTETETSDTAYPVAVDPAPGAVSGGADDSSETASNEETTGTDIEEPPTSELVVDPPPPTSPPPTEAPPPPVQTAPTSLSPPASSPVATPPAATPPVATPPAATETARRQRPPRPNAEDARFERAAARTVRELTTGRLLSFQITPNDAFVRVLRRGEPRGTLIGRASEYDPREDDTTPYRLPYDGDYVVTIAQPDGAEVSYLVRAAAANGSSASVLRVDLSAVGGASRAPSRVVAERAVRFRGEPGNATVILNGESVGVASQWPGSSRSSSSRNLQLSPGTHTIRLEASGYEAVEIVVEIREGADDRVATINYRLVYP
ncbi:MAG: protein kinase [Acidobacteriota bacterium]